MNLPRLILMRACASPALIVIAVACASDDGGGPNPNPVAASVAVSGGDAQVGAPGQAPATPLSVIVRDAATFAAAGAPANITDLTTGSASRVFTVAGTFTYSCTNHIGMTDQSP